MAAGVPHGDAACPSPRGASAVSGLGFWVVDLVGWQDAKANSDKPTQPVPTDPTTPTKIPKKNKAKKDTGKK